MKTPASIVSGAAPIDPSAPSLFARGERTRFCRDEVKLSPPLDRQLEVQAAKKVIESGRSLYLEVTGARLAKR